MASEPGRETALVTGANRGIGFEVGRQLGRHGLRVLVAAREGRAGENSARQLREEGLEAVAVQLDLSSPESVDACASRLREHGEEVDVLVNNAGIYPAGSLHEIPIAVLREAMEVHLFGVARLCQWLVPEMERRGRGRVVNVSSGYGSFAEGLSGPAAYSISKAALNALTVVLAAEVKGDVKVNAACPGWVRTRMGGPSAPTSVEDAADTIVWLATLPSDGPNGGFFRRRRRIQW